MPVCELCNIKLSSQSLLDSHNRGKKHQKRLADHDSLQALAKRSVFLSKFTLPIGEEEIVEALSEFGVVDRVLLDKQNSTRYAIVEFKDEEVASWLVNEMGKIKIAGNDVNIQARRVDFNPTPCSAEASLSGPEVLKLLNGHTGFDSQADILVTRFSIGKSNLESRRRFTRWLEEFLQKRFGSSVGVHLFGSSLNGTGTVKSDMDLNLIGASEMRCDGNERAITLPCSSTHPPDADELAHEPIMWGEFTKLPRAERAKIVGRLVNAYRKESGMVDNIVVVPDARCPVVRFELKHPLRVECELSIDNRLGECKADFIRHVIDQDNSGVLKRFIFVLKLWASSANVTVSSPDHNATPKTQWSSYSLTLLAIHFFQSIGLLGAMENRRDSAEIRGWKVDYDIAPGAGESTSANEPSLSCMFRRFFSFLFDLLQECENRVVSVRDARLYSKEQFIPIADRLHPPFKFSIVNVQDPLELSHNTTANVSKQHLSLLRRKLMYGIVALKQNADDLSQLFDLDRVQRDMETTAPTGKSGGHSITVEANVTFSQTVEGLRSLLEDVLMMEPMSDPARKRLRCESLAMTSSFNHEEEGISMVAHYAVWVGRRQIRRSLARSHPDLHGLLLEREVTREISRGRTAEVGAHFRLHFRQRKSENHSTTLTCHFDHEEEADGEASSHGHFMEMFHFLETFIPAHINEVLDRQRGNKHDSEVDNDDSMIADMECD